MNCAQLPLGRVVWLFSVLLLLRLSLCGKNCFVLAVFLCTVQHFFCSLLFIRCLLANNCIFLFIVQFSPHFFSPFIQENANIYIETAICFFYARLCVFLTLTQWQCVFFFVSTAVGGALYALAQKKNEFIFFVVVIHKCVRAQMNILPNDIRLN